MEDEKQMLEELKKLPDFNCFVLPARWYKTFGLTPPGPIGPREFIESNYTMQCAVAPKDLPAIYIREPQQNGKLVEMAPPEKIDIEVRNRPFELAEIPNVLPSLQDENIGK
jgi:hypothetical protein